MTGCEHCGSQMGPWREAYSPAGGIAMRRACLCSRLYDMFRISYGLRKRVRRDIDTLVEMNINQANRRAADKGYAPSWGVSWLDDAGRQLAGVAP